MSAYTNNSSTGHTLSGKKVKPLNDNILSKKDF